VPCGTGTHTLRWEAGTLRLPSHPDAEAELVLAALGGDKPGCVRLAEAWGRHTDDLSVLAIWPRGADDRITVSWDSVPDPQSGGQAGGRAGGQGVRIASSLQFRASAGIGVPRPQSGQPPARMAAIQAELEQAARRNIDMLSLLALGPGFQVRLSGHVAAAHAAAATAATRPALVAALTGRIALVAEKWIGIDPDQVEAALLTGESWGAVEMSGREKERRLRFTLPADWLASVWACGLALADRRFVVEVTEPGWPDARVLALPAPGAEPIPLDVHGTVDADGNPVWAGRGQ
jgi:hypothetical protein